MDITSDWMRRGGRLAAAALAMLGLVASGCAGGQESFEDDGVVAAGDQPGAQTRQGQVEADPALYGGLEGEDLPARGQVVALPIIKVRPADFIGATVAGQGQVSGVISDRGFWIGEGDNRVFAVVREDVPRPEMIDINEGQQIVLKGLLLPRSAADKLTGTLEPDIKETLDQQPYFVAVYWDDVNVMDETTQARPGMKPMQAQGMRGGMMQRPDTSQMDVEQLRQTHRTEREQMARRQSAEREELMRRQRGEVLEFSRWDKDKNQALNADEFERGIAVIGVYTMLDANADGQVARRELGTGLHEMWDTDRSGVVERDEFEPMIEQRFEQTFGQADFDQWDYDNDSVLSASEFRQGVEQADLFDNWDVDADAQISEQEFSAALYNEVDEDADDAISSDEFWFGQNEEFWTGEAEGDSGSQPGGGPEAETGDDELLDLEG